MASGTIKAVSDGKWVLATYATNSAEISTSDKFNEYLFHFYYGGYATTYIFPINAFSTTTRTLNFDYAAGNGNTIIKYRKGNDGLCYFNVYEARFANSPVTGYQLDVLVR